MIKKIIYKILGVEEKEPNHLLLLHMRQFTEETDVDRLNKDREAYTKYVQERTT